jgi:hypothetical protein
MKQRISDEILTNFIERMEPLGQHDCTKQIWKQYQYAQDLRDARAALQKIDDLIRTSGKEKDGRATVMLQARLIACDALGYTDKARKELEADIEANGW